MGETVPVTATTADLEAAVPHLRAAPVAEGTVDLVVCRPVNGEREILAEGRLDLEKGLVGDNWLDRMTSRAIEAGRHYDAQINVMSARMVRLLGDTDEKRAMAGDQLYLDLDISVDNLPTGTRLGFGDPATGPVIEVTAKPHNGCKKFVRRFGEEAMLFVNSEVGKQLRLRGFNARVVRSGVVRPGDAVRKLD